LVETCMVGDHVVNAYFDGNFAAATDQSGHKESSLRKICGSITREGCMVGRSWLTDAVNLAAQQNELPPDEVEGLGKGHMQALLLVKELKDKIDWAREARKENLGANALRRLIKKELKAEASEGETEDVPKTLDCDAVSRVLDSISKKVSSVVSNGTDGKIIDFEKDEPAKVDGVRTKLEGLMAELETLRSQITPGSAGEAE
jgi:hypothetical protein